MVSLSINPNKDAKLSETLPDTNYGTDTDFQIKISTLSNRTQRSILEFDISSLIDVPIDNISSAEIRINSYFVANARVIDFRRVDNGTWTESGVTWNNQPSTTDYNVEDTWSSTGWNTTSISSILKDAIRDGHTYVGILLKYVDESTDALVHENTMYSSEHGTYPPELNIEYSTYSQTALHNCLCQNRHFIDGFGEITMTDHNCAESGPCDAATFTFKTAWGSTYTPVLLDVGDTVQYDSGIMHHSFKLDSIISYSPTCCDTLTSATIEEKYWENDCYVKTTGDNDRNGTDWTEAWSTIDQAANETFDGQEVHIGFGTYNSEPASNDITPVNFGTTGIKYTPETAGTGGGTGTVTVERN